MFLDALQYAGYHAWRCSLVCELCAGPARVLVSTGKTEDGVLAALMQEEVSK